MSLNVSVEWSRQRILAAATLALMVTLLAFAGFSWRQTISWWTLAWWLFVLLAVRASRPEFAAAAIGPAMVLQPVAGLPLVALAGLTASGLGPRPVWVDPGDAREALVRVEQQLTFGLPTLLAVLAGGLVWQRLDGVNEYLAPVLGAFASIVVLRGAEILAGRKLTPHGGELVRSLLVAGGLWLTAWAWGGVLAQVATAQPVWAAVGLAAMLAVRREGVWKGAVAEEAIRSAADVPAWVERAYLATLQATRCSWFEARLALGGAAERWSAGPDQELRSGPADPPARPPVRFGIHRRPSWINERRALPVDDGELEVLIWRDPRRMSESTLDEQLDELSRIVAAGRFESAVANLPGGQLVDRQRVLELLKGAFASARETGASVAIALVGLDHVREIQEVHGAETSERAVSIMSEVFTHLLGPNDAVCRYGGEEFLALFLGRDGRQALEVADNIRRAIARLELDVDEESTSVTASVGVVAHPEVYVERPSELIPLADSALYEARRRGGDGLLLAVGRGRFQDAEGEIIEGSAESKEVAAPRLFV